MPGLVKSLQKTVKKVMKKRSRSKSPRPPGMPPSSDSQETTVIDERSEADILDAMPEAEATTTVEQHASAFLQYIQWKGWEKVTEEFREGHRTSWEVNRTTRYVIKFNVPPDGDFFDANRVERLAGMVGGVNFVIAAEPDASFSSKETFWRMVYDAAPSLVLHVEKYAFQASKDKSSFVPWKADTAIEYGKMMVINKKLSNDGAMQAVVELIPDGCSNSVITRFRQVSKWPDTVLFNDADGSAMRAALQFARALKDEKGTVIVVCGNGCGKSAMLVLLHAALTGLQAKTAISMPGLLRQLRLDRWGAIHTADQYLMLHLLVIEAIRTAHPALKEKTTELAASLKAHVEKAAAATRRLPVAGAK